MVPKFPPGKPSGLVLVQVRPSSFERQICESVAGVVTGAAPRPPPPPPPAKPARPPPAGIARVPAYTFLALSGSSTSQTPPIFPSGRVDFHVFPPSLVRITPASPAAAITTSGSCGSITIDETAC